jgi:PAS domain S-box-containing protein
MIDNLKVLIIEDSEDDALLVMRELRRGGFTVVWERVETAEELQKALATQTWDVIISDYHLPKFDASRALQIVKQDFPDLPFIVVSGLIGETSAVELMKAGAHDYLMKGSLTRLAEAVRREIREAQIRLERQRSKQELNSAQERLQLAIESSGIGLWDWNVQTGAVTINDRWTEIIGYSIEELAPISFETWQQHTHPDDFQKFNLVLEKYLRKEIQSYECELRMLHKSGAWIWVLSKGKVVEWDAKNNPLRMTVTHLDISTRKQAELRVELQNLILERIAKGEPLADILDVLVRATEEQIEGGVCSILL